MSLSINIYNDTDFDEPLETLRLGTTLLEEGAGGLGEPVQLYIRNEGESTLVVANINLSGEGANSIQLARDENGAHGIWAQPGNGIVAIAGEVKPGENFSFWARGVFDSDDAPDKKPFNFDFELIGKQ